MILLVHRSGGGYDRGGYDRGGYEDRDRGYGKCGRNAIERHLLWWLIRWLVCLVLRLQTVIVGTTVTVDTTVIAATSVATRDCALQEDKKDLPLFIRYVEVHSDTTKFIAILPTPAKRSETRSCA